MKSNEIEAKKINLNTLFGEFWFRVPEFQRSYVWGAEQIDELLDDLQFALTANADKEYFLGSIVLQKHLEQSSAVSYECCDLLDGQQRMTTLFLLMAVLRDIATNPQLKEKATAAIYQSEDIFSNQPERIRMEFLIRDEVGAFVNQFIKQEGGTNEKQKLEAHTKQANISLKNMARSVLYLRARLGELTAEALQKLAVFLFNKVVVIYVASESQEDAFRLFTILNDRGIPLSASDILKSLNIGALADQKQGRRYALLWEEMEGQFGRVEFDRFLGHIRTMIVKEKARDNLLKEFEAIYQKGLLGKGDATPSLIKDSRDALAKLIWFETEHTGDYQLRNLITVMKKGLATDWIPVYLAYYRKFSGAELLRFAEKLESKFSADWVLRLSPSQRLTNTYTILKAIEKATTAREVLENTEIFAYDRTMLEDALAGEVYHKSFARYALLKLEYLMLQPTQQMAEFQKISIEHVLPQNPKEGSQWRQDFSEEQREEWTHKLANLVLLSRIKNSQLNNRDYSDKKDRYFKTSINVFANISTAMQNTEWTVDVLEQRQEHLVNLLLNGYK